MTLNEAKLLTWGTYGKSGKEPLKQVRLGGCSTAHLNAILRTQRLQVRNPEYAEAIKMILESRNESVYKP